MFTGLEIEADLTVAFNHDHFLIVAEDNYVIVSFKDLKTLERVLKNAGSSMPKSRQPAAPKPSGGNPLKQLNEVNELVRALNLIVDVRVGGKTYVNFGAGKSAKITAAAIFGKIGSFFGL